MTTHDARSALPEPRAWSARVFRLGHEPRDDLAEVTTPEQRLAMVWDLTLRMWALTGRPFPSYSRENLPGRVLRLQ